MANRALAQRGGGPAALPPLPQPGQVLPQSSAFVRDGVLVTCLGVAVGGGAALEGYPGLVVPALVGGVVGGVVVAGYGAQRSVRRQLRFSLVEALAAPMGTRQLDRRTVVLKDWTPGLWSSLPQTIELRYSPGAPSDDPLWLAAILATIEARTTAAYSVVVHHPVKCLLKLELRTDIGATGLLLPPSQVRAERTVLELIGPTGRVVDVIMDGDDPRSLTVEHAAGTKLAASGYRARIERVVSTVLPGRWRARWDLEGDRVTFEIRPGFPEQIWVPPAVIEPGFDLMKNRDAIRIPYGVDEDGEQLFWRPAILPHLMVVGRTGTGKTVFVHTVLVHVAALGCPIWVVDGKAVEFLGFRDWPNVQVVASTIWHQVAVIHRAHQLMEHRYKLIDSRKASEDDMEPLMVFVDEYADFRANVIEWWAAVKPPKNRNRLPPVLSQLASLARKGRSAGIHLVFGTQRPDAEYFGGDMRDNFAMVSMGRLSREGSQMVWHDALAATTIPRGIRGRAMSENASGRPVEIQTYRTPDPRRVRDDEEQLALLDALRPLETSHPRLVILPPDLQQDLDSEEAEPPPPDYFDFATAEWGLACDHPAHDPVLHTPVSPEEARLLTSPAAMLGLTSAAPPAMSPGMTRAGVPTQASPPSVEVDEDGGEDDRADDVDVDWRFKFFGEPVNELAEELIIGDLVLVDDTADHWATVDGEPGDDPTDPDGVAICWRDDSDEVGMLSVPYGTRLSVRRPVEEEA